MTLGLPAAFQPDVVRANQKDVYYTEALHSQLADLVQQFRGSRFSARHQTAIRLLADALYYALTTVAGRTTLGEEYCDIVQSHAHTGRYPGAWRRLGMVLAHVFGCSAVMHGAGILARHLKKLRRQEQQQQQQQQQRQQQKQESSGNDMPKSMLAVIPPGIRNRLIRILSPSSTLRARLATLVSVHLMVFYFAGQYYHFAKRLFGVRFVFSRATRPGEQQSSGYEVLGVLLFLQLALKAITAMASSAKSTGDDDGDLDDLDGFDIDSGSAAGNGDGDSDANSDAGTCTLCLSPRKDTTVTPCGHMLCWTCAVEWCRTKPECPLCRQHVQCSQLLPVYNFE